jgi:hypothetical protein
MSVRPYSTVVARLVYRFRGPSVKPRVEPRCASKADPCLSRGRVVKTFVGTVVLGSDGKPSKRQILVGFRDSRTVFGFSDTDGVCRVVRSAP